MFACMNIVVTDIIGHAMANFRVKFASVAILRINPMDAQ